MPVNPQIAALLANQGLPQARRQALEAAQARLQARLSGGVDPRVRVATTTGGPLVPASTSVSSRLQPLAERGQIMRELLQSLPQRLRSLLMVHPQMLSLVLARIGADVRQFPTLANLPQPSAGQLVFGSGQHPFIDPRLLAAANRLVSPRQERLLELLPRLVPAAA